MSNFISNLFSHLTKGTAMSETTKITKKRVSDQEFVVAYIGCKNYADLAAYLGLSVASVASRSNKLRKLGVKLDKYKVERAPKVVDTDALNALIAK